MLRVSVGACGEMVGVAMMVVVVVVVAVTVVEDNEKGREGGGGKELLLPSVLRTTATTWLGAGQGCGKGGLACTPCAKYTR